MRDVRESRANTYAKQQYASINRLRISHDRAEMRNFSSSVENIYIIKPNNNVALVLAKGRRISNFLAVHACITSCPDLTVYRKLLERPFVANQVLSLLKNWSLGCANKIYDSPKSCVLS